MYKFTGEYDGWARDLASIDVTLNMNTTPAQRWQTPKGSNLKATQGF